MFNDHSLGLVVGPSDDRLAIPKAAIYLMDQSDDEPKGELFFTDGSIQKGFYIDSQVIYKAKFIRKNEIDGFRRFTRNKLREIDEDDADDVRKIFQNMRDSAGGEAVYETPFEFISRFAGRMDERGIGQGRDKPKLQQEVEKYFYGGPVGGGDKDDEGRKEKEEGKKGKKGGDKKGVKGFGGNGKNKRARQRQGDENDSSCCIVM